MNCVLCQLSEADVVYATDHWQVVTNPNQNKLGKCMVCLRRHDEDICYRVEITRASSGATDERLATAIVINNQQSTIINSLEALP